MFVSMQPYYWPCYEHSWTVNFNECFHELQSAYIFLPFSVNAYTCSLPNSCSVNLITPYTCTHDCIVCAQVCSVRTIASII